MTVALDATPLIEPTGGIARYTWELARALAEYYPGDEYWLVSDQPFSIPKQRPANLRQGAGPETYASRRWWFYGLNRELARRSVDVFHGTDFSVPYLHRRPAVMTIHDLSPWMNPSWQPHSDRIRRRTPYLLGLGLADHVITPSEAVRKQVVHRFNLAPERVAAVPLAANREFHPSIAAERPYFLFVGTLEPRKNIARLIEAWREAYKSCGVELILAGRLRGDYTLPPPEPGLRYLGAVPEADLAGLYSGALAFVYPSLYEGFGLPVLEAMQCGALVVTSRDPAIMEVTNGLALHVDAEDIRSLGDALLAVARNRPAFDELQKRASDRAQEFSWKETARRTREVYEAALRGSR